MSPILYTNRALAVGLYVMVYNIGGSTGAAAPGEVWKSYAVQLVTIVLAWRLWPGKQPVALAK